MSPAEEALIRKVIQFLSSYLRILAVEIHTGQDRSIEITALMLARSSLTGHDAEIVKRHLATVGYPHVSFSSDPRGSHLVRIVASPPTPSPAPRFYGGGPPAAPSEDRSVRIHRAPGWKLRAFAEHVYSSRTFEAVFDQTLLDLDEEYARALAKGGIWTRRLVRARGYWSFWSAVVAQLPLSILKKLLDIWKAAG